MSQYVYSVTLFDGLTAATGALGAYGTATSDPITVNSMRPLGQFASQLIVSGSGTVKSELWISINETEYVLWDTLFEGKTSANAGTPGIIDIHSVAICMKFKVIITETGGASGATVKQWLGVQ